MRIIPLLLVFSLFAQDAANAPEKSGDKGATGDTGVSGDKREIVLMLVSL